jgi:uncharacterized protein
MDESTNLESESPAQPGPDERNWAVGAHLSALVTLVGLPSFVGPLVVWLIKKDESEFVGEHARRALNFNLSVLLYVIVGTIAAIVILVATLGIGFVVLVPLALIAVVVWIVVVVQATLAASKGESYTYPWTIDFVS